MEPDEHPGMPSAKSGRNARCETSAAARRDNNGCPPRFRQLVTGRRRRSRVGPRRRSSLAGRRQSRSAPRRQAAVAGRRPATHPATAPCESCSLSCPFRVHFEAEADQQFPSFIRVEASNGAC